jgi:hypothetical protein
MRKVKQARATSNQTWQTAKLLVFLLCEFDLVNTWIQLPGALTTVFTGRIEAVKKPLKSLLPMTNLVSTIPAMFGPKTGFSYDLGGRVPGKADK